MNKRKVKGTKASDKKNLVDSKNLERNVLNEISQELNKPKKENK